MAKRRRRTLARVFTWACIAWPAVQVFVTVVGSVDLPRQLESWSTILVDAYGWIPGEVRAFLSGVVVGSGVVWAAERSLATRAYERLKSAGRLLGFVRIRTAWVLLAEQDDPRTAMLGAGMSWRTTTAVKGLAKSLAFGGFGDHVGPVLCFVEVPTGWGIDTVEDRAWTHMAGGGFEGDGSYDRYACQHETGPPGARLLVNVVVVTWEKRLGGLRDAFRELLGRTGP